MERPEFAIFDAALMRRRRGKWAWSIRTAEGEVVMTGSEASRPAAKYQAERALFLLLLTAPYRLRLSV